MIEINKLDIEGLSNLGVGFETDEEMASFAAIVQDNLEVRVGDEMTKIMSPKQDCELNAAKRLLERIKKNIQDYPFVYKEMHYMQQNHL